MLKSIRKSAASLTGIHGFLSGKKPQPVNPINNLPDEVIDETTNYESTKSVSEHIQNLNANLKRVASFDTARKLYPNMNFEMDNYMATQINKNGVYSRFYESLTKQEIDVIMEYQKHSERFNEPSLREANIDSINLLNDIFEKTPRLPFSIGVYRCYKKTLSLNMIDRQPHIDRFLSTTLSFRLSDQYCDWHGGGCKHNKLPDAVFYNVVCILLPKGSRALPLVFKYINYYNEYEILLPPGGKLLLTEECHPKYDVPVFIYFENAEQGLEYQRSKNPEAFPVVQCDNNQCDVIQTQNMSLTSLFDTLLRGPNEPNIEEMGAALSDAYGGKKKKSKKTIKRHKKNKYNRKSRRRVF